MTLTLTRAAAASTSSARSTPTRIRPTGSTPRARQACGKQTFLPFPFLARSRPSSAPWSRETKKIGYGTANSASIDFTIENGVLQTDAFEATSATFRLGAKGQVDLRTMEVAADATINLKGAAGILLSPMSKTA